MTSYFITPDYNIYDGVGWLYFPKNQLDTRLLLVSSNLQFLSISTTRCKGKLALRLICRYSLPAPMPAWTYSLLDN